MALVSTPAILLRSHAYSESSRVLRFLTESHGLVSVMARGVQRRASKGGSGIAVFALGEMVVDLKESRELQSLREFSARESHAGLASSLTRLGAASVMAEVVLKHADQEAGRSLYRGVADGLAVLSTCPDDAVFGEALVHCWAVVVALGFAPDTRTCVRCGSPHREDSIGRFDYAGGGIRCAACASDATGPRVGPVARGQLERLLSGEVPEGLRKPKAHLSLLDDFVTYHILGGRRLESFRFLHDGAHDAT